MLAKPCQLIGLKNMLKTMRLSAKDKNLKVKFADRCKFESYSSKPKELLLTDD
jgi:hypothetical protein